VFFAYFCAKAACSSLCASSSSSYTLPARFLVPKQQFNPGTKTAPPDAGKALQPPGPVPDVAAPQHTRDKDNSSKWLLKDRPKHADVVCMLVAKAVQYSLKQVQRYWSVLTW
jgi:hypothetical protein